MMNKNKAKFIIVLVISLLALTLILQNTTAVETRVLFMTITMPRALLLLVTFLVGFIAGLIAIAQELEIPVIVVFDGDGCVTDAEAIKNNRRDNGCILRLLSISDVDPLPKETMWRENIVMWATNIASSVRADFGENAWNAAQQKVRDHLELQGHLSSKNKVLIAGTLEELWNQGKKSASLIKLCGRILAYAQKIKV